MRKREKLFFAGGAVFVVLLGYLLWPKASEGTPTSLIELEKDPKNHNLTYLRLRDRKELLGQDQQKVELTRENRPIIFRLTANDYRRRAQYPQTATQRVPTYACASTFSRRRMSSSTQMR